MELFLLFFEFLMFLFLKAFDLTFKFFNFLIKFSDSFVAFFVHIQLKIDILHFTFQNSNSLCSSHSF
jgi:hypothetical protein